MKILLNGEPKELPTEFSIDEMLINFALPTELVAIELNREVIRKKDWATIKLQPGDKIEVVHFVGGG